MSFPPEIGEADSYEFGKIKISPYTELTGSWWRPRYVRATGFTYGTSLGCEINLPGEKCISSVMGSYYIQ